MNFVIDRLAVEVFPNREDLGKAAGRAAAEAIRQTIARRGEARVIFAAAPSQNETLETLRREPGIDWTKVTALHMDEYIGLPAGSPARFASYLNEHIFRYLPFKEVFLLDDPTLPLDRDAAVARYKKIIADGPIDVVCMGIGENGHIAFNDPAVARFDDPESVKIVDLDDICRTQQVHDGCFPTLDDVPRQAITLTVPTLFSGAALVCAVPGATKRAAVRQTLTGPIEEACPATILRTHSNAALFVDIDSCDVSAGETSES